MLEHAGDYEQAAGTLRTQGYGGDPQADEDVDLSFLLAGLGSPDEQSEPPPRGYRLLRADEIRVQPPQWLIRGLLEQYALAQIYGDSGAGKSFVAIDLACRIASGTSWRDHPVEAGPVVYVAGEGQNGIGRRINAWGTYHHVGIAGLPLFLGTAIGVGDPERLRTLVQAIAGRQIKPRLIVLDTLARNFGPGDENSTQDMTHFVNACDRLRARWQSTVLIIHHTGLADKTRSRGNSSLRAALDTEYRVNQPERGQIVLTATKLKEAELFDPVHMTLTSVELPDMVDDFGNPVTSAAIDVTDADTAALFAEAEAVKVRGEWQQVILDTAGRLAGDDGGSLDELRAACEQAGLTHRSTWLRAVAALVDQGVWRVNEKEGRYWLT